MIRALIFCLGVLLCGVSFAIPVERRIFQLQHQNWKAKDGVPSSIGSIAQTDDGYLWLGTSAGLYRFDGVHFELYEPREGKLPRDLAYFIKSQPGVGLWIGWGVGGISLVRDGVVTNYGSEAGVSVGSWWGFDFDQQGNVWAAGVNGLLRFDGKKWHHIGEKEGYTARKASAIFVDKLGTVAAFSEKGLFLKKANSAVFSPALGHTDVRQPPQQGTDGRIYLMEESSIRVINDLAHYEQQDNAPIFKGKPGESQSMLIDRSGGLWYETLKGLHRTSAEQPQYIENFDNKDGLSSNTIACFFEDREGNIWLATTEGLDRFRQVDVNRVMPAPSTYSLNQSSLLAGDGNLMTVAAPDFEGGWVVLNPDGVVQNTDWLNRHRQGQAQVVAPGNNETILVADRVGLHQISKGYKDVMIRWPADMGPVHRVRAVAQERSGKIWISVLGVGVLQYQAGTWSHNNSLPKNGTQTAMALLADSQGRMWLGYMDNRIVLIENGNISTFTQTQGLDLGRIAVLHEVDGNIIAGGEKGMALYRNHQFHDWTAGENLFRNTSSIVHSKTGDIWVNSAAGTVRISSALSNLRMNKLELRHAQIRALDVVDGRLGASNLLEDFSLAEAGDGKIWIANEGGVSWIDPSHLLTAPKPRPVIVEEVMTGKQHFRLPLAVTLEPASHAIQINYSSPILGTPERMRFKYRLDGYDTEWQDAGSRRQAFYTGVPPGKYKFRVMASNGSNNWSDEGTGLVLTLKPMYYETWWFNSLVVALIVWLLWLGFQFRLRRTAKTLAVQMEARHGERERIARELHDTLLQGMQALILGVDNATRALAPNEPTREKFNNLLERAETALAEGRDQVFELRDTGQYEAGLFCLIERDGQALTKEVSLNFVCREFGKRRDLLPVSCHEIYRIAIEGITNTVKHANAKNLIITVRYGYFALTLEIDDDGIGIPPQVLATRGTQGHFGLQGLFERAEKLHTNLKIQSKNSGGTLLKVRVPARFVYVYKSLKSTLKVR